MIRLLLIASLAFGVSCGKEEAEKKTDPKSTEVKAPAGDKSAAKPDPGAAKAPVAAKPKAAEATEFVSAEHKFSVMSMQKPRTSKPAAPAGSGPITSYMFSKPGAPGAYMILVATVPLSEKATDAERKKAITDGRDGIMKKYGATISADKEIEVDGNPGRDFSFSASHPQMGPMAGRSKIVVRGKELFQVMRVGKPDATALIAEADALIDSFKFTK